ncbi:MAG: DUF1232 domain-containing protein [Micavibrio sp.]|nr:MAG: DUF1232 domain-containing protein [Micavibrio sp.]
MDNNNETAQSPQQPDQPEQPEQSQQSAPSAAPEEKSAEKSAEDAPQDAKKPGRIKQMLTRIKHDIVTIYLIGKDPRLSKGIQIFALCIIAYAVSPVDLIPDFIPVIGYLDDIILLVPAAYFLYKMVPPEILKELRQKAVDADVEITRGMKIGAISFVLIMWTAFVLAIYFFIIR